jgi:hypothetical protein
MRREEAIRGAYQGPVRLPCHSLHKFRHGHAICAPEMAKDVSALKADSQNLLHENLSITDGVYGVFSDMDVRNQIAVLRKPIQCDRAVHSLDEVRSLIRRLSEMLADS